MALMRAAVALACMAAGAVSLKTAGKEVEADEDDSEASNSSSGHPRLKKAGAKLAPVVRELAGAARRTLRRADALLDQRRRSWSRLRSKDHHGASAADLHDQGPDDGTPELAEDEDDESHGTLDDLDDEIEPLSESPGKKLLKIATWNAMSIAKTAPFAHLRPGMDSKAMKKHNGLMGCKRSSDVESEKQENGTWTEPWNHQVGCVSWWFPRAVKKIFQEHKLDAMVVQEIDWLMLAGYNTLSSRWRHLPITGLNAKMKTDIEEGTNDHKHYSGKDVNVEQWLKMERETQSKGRQAGDFTFLLWDDRKIDDVTCTQVGGNIPVPGTGEVEDMSQVGLCRFIVKGLKEQTDFVILGMNADEKRGFTANQAGMIGEQADRVDLVLGDMHSDSKPKINAALETLKLKPKYPSEAPDQMSIYRNEHPYWKILDAFIQTKAHEVTKLNNKGEATGKREMAQCEATQDEGGNDAEARRKASSREKARRRIIQICHAMKAADEKPAPEPGSLEDMDEHYLTKIFREMKRRDEKIWRKIYTLGYDLNNLGHTLGINMDWKVTDSGMKLLKPEVKREDWVIYDNCMFDEATAEIPVLPKLRSEAEASLAHMKVATEPSKPLAMPILEWPCDHLPVIVTLKYDYPRPSRVDLCRAEVAAAADAAVGIQKRKRGWAGCLDKIRDLKAQVAKLVTRFYPNLR